MRPVPLEMNEIARCLEHAGDWSCVSVDGVERIERTFAFSDQAHANNFTQLLGELSDAAHHHPSLLLQRLNVTVAWWTFSLGSLTRIDFVMAERTDRLYEALAN